MKWIIFLTLPFLVAAGFANPEFKDRKYNNVLVYVDTSDFYAIQQLELRVGRVMGKWTKLTPSTKLFSPTESHTKKHIEKTIEEKKFDALIVISPSEIRSASSIHEYVTKRSLGGFVTKPRGSRSMSGSIQFALIDIKSGKQVYVGQNKVSRGGVFAKPHKIYTSFAKIIGRDLKPFFNIPKPPKSDFEDEEQDEF